jgi:Putative DNA-binding domain
MIELRELQRQFQHAIRTQHTEHFVNRVLPGAYAESIVGVEVYGAGYLARLIEVLELEMPALARLVGDGIFRELGRTYLTAYPSRSPSLRGLAANYAGWLATQDTRPDAAAESELARFEWALTEVFDAADAPVLASAALAAHPPEQWPRLRLGLHPSLRLVLLKWNTLAQWRAYKHAAPALAPMRLDAPSWVVCWRRELSTYFEPIPTEAASALTLIRAGHDLACVCDQLAAALPADETATHFVRLLRQWFDMSLITELIIESVA